MRAMAPRQATGHAVGTVLLSLAMVAVAIADPLPAGRRQAIDRFIEPYVELAMFDGSVLVDVAGEVVYRRSFGFANYEHRVVHDPDTRFRIASVSKTVTDAAVAALVQQGKLTVDTPLSTYLPDFPSAEKITVGQLLDSTSGIPHTNRLPWGDGKTSLPLDEIVARLAALPLDFEPGTDSAYTNGGYAVAAKVLEIAGGGSYAEVMRRTVFEPLGMADTAHIDDAREPIPGMATGYEPGAHPGERRHSRFYAAEIRPGGGSLYSTVDDMLAFARGVFRRGFIREELRRSVLGADDGPFLAQGRAPGFVAKLLFDPELDLIVVSLANNYAVPADWARAIADLAAGRVDASPWPRLERAPLTVAADDPRLGTYRTSRGATQAIERSDRGAMFIADPRGDSVTGLVPLSGGAFLYPIYYQLCEQDAETRAITCRILSGDERYTTEYTPLAD